MIYFDYICEILGRFEGRGIMQGYVPCKGGNYTGVGMWEGKDVYGASGVTIGTGFDLGQQSTKVLQSLGLSNDLQKKLFPYLGLQKETAMKKLQEIPLAITSQEVNELNFAVKTAYINNTAKLFGREQFESAPKQAQAVAVSLCYQFGTPKRDASPGLGLAWGALVCKDYKDAARYLTEPQGWSFDHRQYLKRREQEAALLREIA